MEDHSDIPRALFLSHNSGLIDDARVCSGEMSPGLGGKACPFSSGGRFPGLTTAHPAQLAADPNRPSITWEVPGCVDKPMGRLGAWIETELGHDPVADLQVFRCLQMFLLVIPGLQGTETDSSQEPDQPR